MSEPKYRLQTFGGLAARATGADSPVLVDQRKRLALLAALAASPNGSVSREKLLAWFWPESDDMRARNALKQLVHSIRRELGAEAIADSNGALALATDIVTSDVERFGAALRSGALPAAVAEYRGPFLDGVYLRDAPGFERWVDERRQQFAHQHASALERLTESALNGRDSAAAVTHARALAALDPLSTRWALLLVRALDAAGDRAAAIRHGEMHARLLQAELSAAPAAELDEALRDLRRGSAKPASTDRVDAGPAAPLPPIKSLSAVRQQSPRTRTLSRALVAGGVVAGLGLFVSVLSLRSPATLIGRGTLAPGDTLVLADFEVAGLDSSNAPALTTMLRRDFAEYKAVALMPPNGVTSALEQMRRPRGSRITLEVAREIAIRDGLRGVLSGTVSPLASGYLITLRLIAPEAGNELASSTKIAVNAERDLLPALANAGQELRHAIGDSLRQSKAAPVPQRRRLTTSSLEAARLIWGLHGLSAPDKIAAHRAAVRLDTAFAYAWSSIGNMLDWTGYRSAARDSAFTMAYRFRDNGTLMERAQVSGLYWWNVQRDRRRAAVEMQSVLALDTTVDGVVSLNMTEMLNESRQFEHAEAFERRIERWKTVGPAVHGALVKAQVAQGKYAAAESTIERRRSARGATDRGILAFRLTIALSQLRLDSAETLLAGMRKSDVVGNWAALHRVRGRLADAHRMDEWLDSSAASTATAAGARFDPTSRRALALAREALWLGHDPAAAVARLDARWRTPPPIHDIQDRIDGVQAAALYAAAGRSARAHVLLAAFESGADTTAERAIYEHRQAALAEIALAEGRFNDAMALFRASDLGADGLPASACAVCILPHLARVAERAGWADSARVFWEAYVTRPAIERLSADQWFLATAYSNLAALAAKRGDAERAAKYRGALAALRAPRPLRGH